MLLALLSSVLIAVFGKNIPWISEIARTTISKIDFHTLVMQIMLSFLLFAGSYHIDQEKLRKVASPILILATIGTIISTFIVGGFVFLLLQVFHLQIPLIYCLLFGALISPTDPIAVLNILRQANIPYTLELKILGESLFNDGIGVVIFITIMDVATTGTSNLSAMGVTILFLEQAVGGVIFGILLGYLGIVLMKPINNYKVEILITLALVMCGYSLADLLHVSGPLAMVLAGIITGNRGKRIAMSDTTHDYISKFWELIDEILNAILFLLIGFEMLVIPFNYNLLIIGIITSAIVLFARWFSVALPVTIFKRKIKFEKNEILLLTWGGLRGGLSVALALSIPENMHRNEIVAITYIVAIFSITVQGTSISKFASRVFKSGS
jgi:CPA1 family monovalent cation:H+ antiporter